MSPARRRDAVRFLTKKRRISERIAELERLFARHGKPQLLRSDNGREFIAASLADSLAEHGVRQAFIEKGSPQQNLYVERFNGTMRTSS